MMPIFCHLKKRKKKSERAKMRMSKTRIKTTSNLKI